MWKDIEMNLLENLIMVQKKKRLQQTHPFEIIQLRVAIIRCRCTRPDANIIWSVTYTRGTYG